MKLNVNLKILKREEHEARRKMLHLASAGNASMEVERDLQAACGAIRKETDVPSKKTYRDALKISSKIMDEVNKLLALQASRANTWYNEDRNYKIALEEVALLKEMAMAKFRWWQVFVCLCVCESARDSVRESKRESERETEREGERCCS